jgi:hypothetical protein
MFPVPWRCALALLAFPSLALAQVPVLELTHSGARLGRPLELRLTGAPPGASILLLRSDGRGCAQWPEGLLELERDTLRPLALGRAEADGTWSLALEVPLDRALAERPLSIQALVQDPLAPAGWVLSPPAHLQLAASRLYATCWGSWIHSAAPAELRVYSALDEALLGVIPLDPRPLIPAPRQQVDDGKPVFSADFARGAVVASAERLVIFDNTTFQVHGRVTLTGPAAGTLLADPDGESVLVLEVGPPARILRVHLGDVAVTAVLDLPHSVAPVWVTTRGGAEAWIAEEIGGPAVHGVDLATLTPLEHVSLPPRTGSSFTALRAVEDILVATTVGPLVFPFWDGGGHLIRLDTSHTSDLQAQWFSLLRPYAPTPLPHLGLFVLPLAYLHGPAPSTVHLSRWNDLFVSRLLPPTTTPFADSSFRAFEPTLDGLWTIEDDSWGGDPSHLLHLALPQGVWSDWGSWINGTAMALAVVRDPLVHKVYVSIDGFEANFQRPELFVLEPELPQSRVVPLGWGPQALRAVTVP